MKTYLLSVTIILAISTSPTFADTTSLQHWICKTNASSSNVASEKAADDKMASTSLPATDAFAYASANCRDCTKITCESQNK